ncbi:uncharacterized protein C2845_PM03G14520 [Panicum miliaceum]|uniref:Uncharacterized protein n=1 Tax=Panicum miliaceum TaxID=4540 RepID=A0A3L6T7K6_PANMI|nr:uncharacterized protein C2845_PM03G14520 [Panicum miliaceum]
MEEGIKEGEPKRASGATADQAKMSTTVGGMEDATFKSIGDVLKLLPTATVIVYQVLNPIVTNAGACHVGYKIATGILLGLCGFFCAFSTFTDSYVGADGKVKYGLVTPRGLLPFADSGAAAGAGRDFSRYRLRFSDFVHAAFAVAVFAAVALLADANTGGPGCKLRPVQPHARFATRVLPYDLTLAWLQLLGTNARLVRPRLWWLSKTRF